MISNGRKLMLILIGIAVLVAMYTWQDQRAVLKLEGHPFSVADFEGTQVANAAVEVESAGFIEQQRPPLVATLASTPQIGANMVSYQTTVEVPILRRFANGMVQVPEPDWTTPPKSTDYIVNPLGERVYGGKDLPQRALYHLEGLGDRMGLIGVHFNESGQYPLWLWRQSLGQPLLVVGAEKSVPSFESITLRVILCPPSCTFCPPGSKEAYLEGPFGRMTLVDGDVFPFQVVIFEGYNQDRPMFAAFLDDARTQVGLFPLPSEIWNEVKSFAGINGIPRFGTDGKIHHLVHPPHLTRFNPEAIEAGDVVRLEYND